MGTKNLRLTLSVVSNFIKIDDDQREDDRCPSWWNGHMDVAHWQILLQKSLGGGERIPRAADVLCSRRGSDQIDLSNRSRTLLVILKSDAWAGKPKINCGEISRYARFPSF